MTVLLWGSMIHFLVPNQKLKMQCNFIMNRSIASGPRTIPKIVRTRLTKNQRDPCIYVCMHACEYIYTYAFLLYIYIYILLYLYIFLPTSVHWTLFPSLGLSICFLVIFSLPFSVSLFVCLCYSVFSLTLPMPPLGLSLSLTLSLSFWISCCALVCMPLCFFLYSCLSCFLNHIPKSLLLCESFFAPITYSLSFNSV